LISTFIYDHLDGITNDFVRERIEKNINKFRVYVYPTTAYNSILNGIDWRSANTGNLSDMIPHEIVGFEEIKIFLIDTPKDVDRRSNIMAITHGFGHVMLFSKDRFKREPLVIDDLSGNKKGTKLNWYTSRVHNRTISGSPMFKTYLLTVYELFGKWKPNKYYVFDFRDDMIEG